jgi:hypothetical protein
MPSTRSEVVNMKLKYLQSKSFPSTLPLVRKFTMEPTSFVLFAFLLLPLQFVHFANAGSETMLQEDPRNDNEVKAISNPEPESNGRQGEIATVIFSSALALFITAYLVYEVYRVWMRRRLAVPFRQAEERIDRLLNARSEATADNNQKNDPISANEIRPTEGERMETVAL